MISDFRSNLETAAAYPEERFAAFLLAADHLAGKLAVGQRSEVIATALTCGREVAAALIRKHGAVEPQGMGRALGIEVSETDLPGPRLTLSLYEPNRKRILLSRAALADFARTYAAHDLVGILGPIDLASATVAHELFHHVESGDPGLYTRQKIITVWKLGPISYRSTLPAASEIAAMACAKSLCRLPFSPVLLEAVLLRAAGLDQASALFARLEEVM
jgi:hypothetical protein